MRLAISNIAWDIAEDEAVATILKQYGVDAIDIAPGKYFPHPIQATSAEIKQVKAYWEAHGIEITGMQALLFGTTELNVFGTAEVQLALLKHLDAVCRIGEELGSNRMVFGSPKNRDRKGLNDAQTMAVAVPFFSRLGEIAASHGVIICLEPNPPCYGANFMTTSVETARVVVQTGHPAIRMQFDTGAVAINKENPFTVLREYAKLIGHIHASEPNLVPLGDGDTDHSKMATALAGSFPNHLLTIEMLATKNESHLVSIERALRVAIHHYCSNLDRQHT